MNKSNPKFSMVDNVGKKSHTALGKQGREYRSIYIPLHSNTEVQK